MDPALWELLAEGPDDQDVAAIVRLRQDAPPPDGVRVVARFGDVATCRLRRGDIRDVHGEEVVQSLKAPRFVQPEPASTHGGAAPDDPDDAGADDGDGGTHADPRRPPQLTASGRGVVVGAVDWGLDIAHPDFRHPDGRTRLVALWDQRGGRQSGSPEPYGYGRLHLREDIDRALESADPYGALSYHPGDADPDASGSHGTHVLSIAAGNGRGGGQTGMAPDADLVFIHLASGGTGRRTSLGDSVALLEAVHLVGELAGERPCVVNASVGRHGGPHDGSTLVERGLDHLVAHRPNRCVVQSCGNYHERHTHASGRLLPGASRTLRWEVDVADRTPNELEIWYSAHDAFVIELTAEEAGEGGGAPDQEQGTVRLRLGESAPLLVAGREVGHAYHRAHDPNNGRHHVDVFVGTEGPMVPWRVTLIGEDVVDGRFNSWVERDATCPGCQSRFAPDDSDARSTTGTICNGLRTIAVGAYDARSPRRELAPFSSSGPTVDGRQKPECLAPGVRVQGARSRPLAADGEVPRYVRKSGTSMAAPYVAGTVACMYEAAGRPLRIEEVRAALAHTSARTGPGVPQRRAGAGYVDPAAAVAAVSSTPAGRPPPPSWTTRQGGTEMDEHAAELTTREDEDAEWGAWVPDFGPATAEVLDSIAADEVITVGATAVKLFEHELVVAGADPAPVLAGVTAEAEVAARRIEGPEDLPPLPRPEVLYDTLMGYGDHTAADHLRSRIEVIGHPGGPFDASPVAGDLLVRRPPGEPGAAHVAMLVTGELITAEQLLDEGLTGERAGPGRYAHVVEGGARPHRAEDRFARRVTDPDGSLPTDQLLARTLPDAAAHESAGLIGHVQGTAALVAGPTLRRGASGPAVEALQHALTALGYAVVADGRFGPATQATVRAFQASAGLTVDGVVGPATTHALALALAARGVAAPPTPAPPTPPTTPAAAPRPLAPGPDAPIPIPVPPPCVTVPQLTEPDRACSAGDARNFAGVPAIRGFAEQLADCVAARSAERRARGETLGRRAAELADLAWLERDFADTLRAAHGRAGDRCRFAATARGWMHGRREQADFETLGTGGRPLGIEGLLPAAGNDQLEPMEVNPTRNFPVQPLLNRFLRALRSRHPITQASNYSARHGGGAFRGRGYSVDLYIGGGTDERGFYHRPNAVRMLLAADAAGRAVGAQWRVLYNDHAVAAAVNGHTGLRHVVFIGSVRPGGTNLNWHGPLILHFHLDIAPVRR